MFSSFYALSVRCAGKTVVTKANSTKFKFTKWWGMGRKLGNKNKKWLLRQHNYTVVYTRFQFVENAFAFLNTALVRLGHIQSGLLMAVTISLPNVAHAWKYSVIQVKTFGLVAYVDVLHTSCLLRLLKGSSSLTDHTCPSCNSEEHIMQHTTGFFHTHIWPPKQQVVSSDSTLCKQLEKLTRKNCATMSDGSFGAQLPFTCDLLPTVSNSSFQGISGTVYMTGTTVFSSSSPLVEINKDQTTQNFNFSGHSSHRENGERKSKPNAMEHIEAAKSSSPEIISTKTVESPKHTKVLSRKNSLRGDKETTEYPIEECGKESKYALKGE
eukprot:Gb_31120 [translate_table: standard]